MKLSIGNDHAGTEYKKEIIDFLILKGTMFKTMVQIQLESVDYPDFIHPVAKDVASKIQILELLFAEGKRCGNDRK